MTHGIDRHPPKFVVLIASGDALFISHADILIGRQFDPDTTKFVEVGTFAHRGDRRQVLEMLEVTVLHSGPDAKLNIVQD